MARNNDILFMSEYIKNVLYFATVRPGKVFKSSAETHFFCIDDELVYENYYLDFGPLNLGCVYKYCRILNEKLEKCLSNQIIVHYTSFDYKKRTNAAFLLGCFGVLYLSLPPKEALKPLIVPGHSYRPFQDATPCESAYTISILDCLQAINKARDIGFFNFQDFNYEEYDRLDKLQGGDLNWIVPGKFLAFIGPVENRSMVYHRPEDYINYFKENNVQSVIRLNKRLYDGNVFNNANIAHYDLFFPDGSCPPRNILLKFLQISETSDGAIAVHCKAGLGRTGSLIGCYLIKHYRMTSHEAIGWMRICRPGSVIGQQQEWLEQLEPWLIKQGNLYRRRKFGDVDKLPVHEYGLYSINKKTRRERPVLFSKSPSPPPPIRRHYRADCLSQPRPQASKMRGGASISSNDNEECNWRLKPTSRAPCQRNSSEDRSECKSRRSSGSGDPRQVRWPSHDYAFSPTCKGNYSNFDEYFKISSGYATIPTFCTTQGPIVRTINEAKEFLMRSSAYKDNHERQLNSTFLTSKSTNKKQNLHHEYVGYGTASSNISSNFTVGREQQHYRRRLGRSPSPIPLRSRPLAEHSRATNTPTPNERLPRKDSSKSTIRDALSRMKLAGPRYGSQGTGSVGAASLGARRAAPAPKLAPSVRSDERPTATQGDMLNSIKLHRRFRETLTKDKGNSTCRSGQDCGAKEKNTDGSSRTLQARTSSPKPKHCFQTSLH